MTVFFVFSLLSASVNQDSKVIMRATMILLLYFSASIIIPWWFKGRTEKYVIRIMVITHIPLLLIPLLLDKGVVYTSYKGLFRNPNSLGIVSATLMIIFVSYFLKQMEDVFINKVKINKKGFLFNSIMGIITLYLMIYSSSRTSFIALLVVVGVGVFLMLVTLTLKGKLGILIFKSTLSLPFVGAFVFLIVKFTPLPDLINKNILEKFHRKSGNLLASRDVIWQQSIDAAGFFGGGTDLFYGVVGRGSHNTFVSLLGTFGWVPALMIALLFGVALTKSLLLFTRNTSEYKYFPPLMLVGFLALSMGEDMQWTAALSCSFIMAGLVMNKSNIIIKGYNHQKISEKTLESA